MPDTLKRAKAAQLLALHTGNKPLILPNVWNPIGARVLAQKGYPAVATASAALSASLGFEDGEKLQRTTLIDFLRRIARSVEIPVSADIEAGYGESDCELQQTIEQVLEAGVVGINIEDSLQEGSAMHAIEAQAHRIALVREVANRARVHLVINARVDSFFSPHFASREVAMEDVVLRAKSYAAAGADCIYPIGPGDELTVRTLRRRIGAPINILCSAKAAPLALLGEIGVNRISFGPYVFRACLRRFAQIADGIAQSGDTSWLGEMLSMDETAVYLSKEREPARPVDQSRSQEF